MRVIAVILMIICLAAAALTGYVYLNANVTVTGVDCVAADAADMPEVFAALRDQVKGETFTGTPFDVSGLGEASGYQFYTYTVQLTNRTFVDAEVAEVQVTPMNRDVLQAEETSPRTIPARGTGTARAVILTEKGMHNVRELIITYYLWGIPFSEKVTYSK